MWIRRAPRRTPTDMRIRLLMFGFAVTAAACQPATTRPWFTPLPEAPGSELRLRVREATRRLAEALRADTIPIRRIELRDGYLESPWFDARNGRPTSRRPSGPGVVRVRAWVDPARPGSSQLTIETLYRPVMDPSLPVRELERQVARDHRTARKVEGVLGRLVQRYGTPPPPPQATRQPEQPAASDSE
jgi:hypothetical protein